MFGEKTCSRCNGKKSVNEFSKDKSTKDGYQSYCKICARAYHQSKEGKEAKRKYNNSDKGRVATERHKRSDKRKQSVKRFWQSGKGKQAQKRINQSKGGKQARKRYNQSQLGKETAKRLGVIRRTRQTQVGGTYTTAEWYSLCKFYGFCCLKCNKEFPFEKLTLDHVKPVSKGGTSFIWNIQPLCKPCNSRKGAKEIDYRQTLPDWINRDGAIWIQDRLF